MHDSFAGLNETIMTGGARGRKEDEQPINDDEHLDHKGVRGMIHM